MTPLEVLESWFDAHRRGDLAAARALLVEDARIELPDREVVGFDGLMEFFAERAASRPGFSYGVREVLVGQTHVAALLDLHEDGREWRQVAVYTVRDDRIVSIWSSESPYPVGT